MFLFLFPTFFFANQVSQLLCNQAFPFPLSITSASYCCDKSSVSQNQSDSLWRQNITERKYTMA